MAWVLRRRHGSRKALPTACKAEHAHQNPSLCPAEHLATPEAQAEYISAALETGGPAFIADSLAMVARARGMAQLARDTGLRAARVCVKPCPANATRNSPRS